jgi:O-antigen ligase
MQASWKEAVANLKWLLLYVCLIKAHGDRRWLSVVLFIYIIGAIDAGWQTTFDPRRGRGVRGGTATTGDENFVAAHMVALLPVMACYVISPKTRLWMRGMFVVGAPLMLNVVAHARSRGAFLALLAVALMMPFLARGRLRTWTIIGLVLGGLLSARLFAENFWERMATITNENSTGSGRTVAWAEAWRLSLRNPVGWGGEAFDRGLKANPDFPSTHNMYFECLVAWGFQGTFLWLAYIGTTMWDCRKLFRGLYRPGQWPPSRECLDSIGILMGMVGMVVASVFLNRMRWELWWVFGAYVVCLKNTSVLPRRPAPPLNQTNMRELHPTFGVPAHWQPGARVGV